MSFFKKIILFFIILTLTSVSADSDDKKNNLIKQAKEVTENLEKKTLGTVDAIDDEDVPLNDPFAGNEGTSGNSSVDIETGEERDEMSLYNFKLSGIISGKENSYISLTNSSGEIITLTLGQYLGKIKLIDLRLTEAIFKKEEKDTYMIIDFNQQIRESNEY
jgi:Tfp pilus assembly protein PilP